MISIADLSSYESIAVNNKTYLLPKTEDELKHIIVVAKAIGKKICVRGSGHSYPLVPDSEQEDDTCIYVMLSYFDSVEFDDENMRVTVGGGCHLGLDPFDPTKRSTFQNSLFGMLYCKRKWAIPEMGGIIHQTVAGFLSTGSSGGSLRYSFNENLLSLTIVTAESIPQTLTFTRGGEHELCAAAISLGMFGFIISATFQCYSTFNIKGEETTTLVEDCKIDLFDDGENGLENFMRTTQYMRFYWWPQPNVTKIVLWQARQIAPDPSFVPKPYQEEPAVFGSNIPSELVEHGAFQGLNKLNDWSMENFIHAFWTRLQDKVSQNFYSTILPDFLNKFLKPNVVQCFRDYWYSGLCMDNKVNEKLVPVKFTELWIPVIKAKEVMQTLQDFYKTPENTGTFCTEIYGAKKSEFWLSPAFGEDMIRIDVFWFEDPNNTPFNYFQKYWDKFSDFGFRCHWGKYLPTDIANKSGAEYLQSQYPRWSDWIATRAIYDPEKVFVTPYWQQHLNII